MAKRKPSRRVRPASGAAPRVRRQVPVRKARPAARKAASKKRPASRPAGRKAGARRAAPKAAVARRVVRAVATARTPKARPASKPAALKARRTTTPARKTAAPQQIKAKHVKAKAATSQPVKATPVKPRPKVVASKPTSKVAPVRAVSTADQAKRKHVLDLGRERRRVQEDEVVSPMPPSSLGLDRTASAARSGRQELRERFDKHNETSPALTGGDVDADWESAYAVGDEAPGGDNPTPDQNNVDDIGVAVGVEYDDNEELEGAERIEERDRHRWEFDPASSDDFDER